MSAKAATLLVGGKPTPLADVVQQALGGTQLRAVKSRRIASLWSGYGSISEVTAETADGKKLLLIAKQVDPPSRRGDVSHDRKIKSYVAEAAFYAHHAAAVIADGAAAIASPLLVEAAPPHVLLLLSDLRVQHPAELYGYDLAEAKAALDWLAAFHALFWESVPGQAQPISHASELPAADGSSVPDSLWDQGCYWHLDTRAEELASMRGSWGELRAAAHQLDEVLKGICEDGSKTASARTLVHGDYKSANLLFSDAASGQPLSCAVYDFQYVGEGLGMRDVAYMFCSSVDEACLEKHEQQLLQHYHAELCVHLARHGKQEAAARYSLQAAAAQLDLCVADFTRFMAGWRGGSWGASGWASARTRRVLQQLPSLMRTARAGW